MTHREVFLVVKTTVTTIVVMVLFVLLRDGLVWCPKNCLKHDVHYLTPIRPIHKFFELNSGIIIVSLLGAVFVLCIMWQMIKVHMNKLFSGIATWWVKKK